MGIVQLLFILACAVTASLACSCMGEHPQKQFCKSDFVVRAYVESTPKAKFMPNNLLQMPWPEQVYNVQIWTVFKGDETAIKAKKDIYTPPVIPSAMGSCNVELKPRTFYLLLGKIVAGNLYTKYCDWREEWNKLTSEQLGALRMHYSKGCECSIGFCFGPRCGLPGCNGYHPNVDYTCRKKYQRCEKRVSFSSESRCAWVSTTRRSCVKNLLFP